jgi:uncharacterized RDD family membrane protein YckC
MEYAGFWRRFGAMWIDMLVFTPVIVLAIYLEDKSRLFQLYWLVPSILIGIWFNVYLVFRYGGTPGKLLLNIQVSMLDGAKVTLKSAFMRYVVLFVISLFTSVGMIMATFEMSDVQYLSLDIIERQSALDSIAPSWYTSAQIATQVWVWSEFIIMLFNHKRRAIHDFMAGTIVIKKT